MGKRIGKYELGRTLGSGNFSKVKVGVDTETGQSWAIKIIEKELLARERMQEQLMREIAMMKKMRHPFVVDMREVLQTTNHIYIVLELVTGGELFDRIVSSKRFDEPAARRFFQQLIQGVRYCHSLEIAHRDIKPENLLLDKDNNIKITDFGLSNLQKAQGGSEALLQTVCGTPNYVAPEVLKERGYNGFKADIWSCGVVLFVMLAGYLPFDDSNTNALFNKIERGEYRMSRSFSDSARDLISRLLTVNPEKRITIDEIMAHPWFVVDYHPVTVGAVSVTNEDTTNAMQEVSDARPSGGPPVPQAATRAPGERGIDAFDIISRMTSGSLNPLVTVQTTVPRTCTRFFFLGTVEELSNTLNTMKANPKLKDNEVKGFLTSPKGLLTYVVYYMPTVSPMALVELRRGRGDVMEFHNMFRMLLQALGPKVRSRELVMER